RLAVEGPSSALARWAGIGTVVTAMPPGLGRPPRIDVVFKSDPHAPGFFAPGPTNQRVSISVSAAGRVDATIATDRADTLVFSEVLYPGWRVLLDGQPRPLVTVEDRLLAGAVSG